jgi:hypothetical protein
MTSSYEYWIQGFSLQVAGSHRHDTRQIPVSAFEGLASCGGYVRYLIIRLMKGNIVPGKVDTRVYPSIGSSSVYSV